MDPIIRDGTLIGVALTLITILWWVLRQVFRMWRETKEFREKTSQEYISLYKETKDVLTDVVVHNTLAFEKMHMSLDANTKASEKVGDSVDSLKDFITLNIVHATRPPSE